MTEPEFREWIEHHEALFPAFSGWLLKMDGGKRSILIGRWMQALQFVRLADAKRASDRMSSGDIEAPRSYEKIPSVVRSACGGSAVPQAAHDCVCEGMGTVDVLVNGRFRGRPRWYPGDRFIPSLHVVGVACLCPKGQWIKQCRDSNTPQGEEPFIMPVYDPQMMRTYRDFMRSLMAAERADSELRAQGLEPCHVAGMSAMPNSDMDNFDMSRFEVPMRNP